MAMMKKGNQQMTNAPVIIASVLAAFLSLLDSAATFFLRTLRGEDASSPDKFPHDGSRSKPLWKDVFSGDVLAELAVVNAVVVVVVVGSVRSCKKREYVYSFMVL